MPAAPTWRACLAETLELLEVPPAASEPILRAYGDVAAEWAEAGAYDPPPFSSGICPDGTPLELSLRIGPGGLSQVRFIAQAADPGTPDNQSMAFEIARSLDFVRHWAGPAAEAQLDDALSIFSPIDAPAFTGNFRLWLGAAADTSGAYAAKVYFNPWACTAGHQGALALYLWLNVAGYTSEGLEGLRPWLVDDVGGLPHIVGWNLTARGVTAVKLYLQGIFGGATLRRMTADPETGADAWTQWTQAGVHLRPRGEVHVAVVCRPDVAPVTRLNLFCSDWFRSDEEVLAALGALFPGWSDRIRENLARTCRHSRRRGRVLNFVSLDPRAATIYLKIG